MTQLTVSHPRKPNAAVRLWTWLRAIEAAMDRDPTDVLRERVDRLEARIEALERTKC